MMSLEFRVQKLGFRVNRNCGGVSLMKLESTLKDMILIQNINLAKYFTISSDSESIPDIAFL